MGALVESVEHEFNARRARHPGRPDRELLEHLLVGLQRERIVSVGYEGKRLSERLARTPLPAEAQELLVRAIGKVWLDETMHARYFMGVLLQQRHLQTNLSALQQSAEGGVAGWILSVQQLSRFRDSPGEHGMAAALELAGKLAGKVPDEVKQELTHKSLRAYCAFNADAEESAALSFGRMLTLSQEVRALADPSLVPSLVLPDGFEHEIARMQHDEVLHLKMFQAIGAQIDERDGLLSGTQPGSLAATLAAIDPWLVPLRHQVQGPQGGAPPSPVGQGGPVVIGRGAGAGEKLEVLLRTLERSYFLEHVERRAACSGKPRAEVVVAIKPDLMMAYHRDDRSTFTDPASLEALIDVLHGAGFRDIRVCESQNLYSGFYRNRTVEAVARYVGCRPERYRVVDLTLEQVPHAFSRGMGVYAVGKSWREADVRICFAKLKTHVEAAAHLCLRTLGMVVPQLGDYLFSTRVSDLSSVCMAVIHDFPVHFGVIDGYEDAADGLLGMLADPTPKHPFLFVAGPDVLGVDTVAFSLMGEDDPLRSADMKAGYEWFGDPRPTLRVVGDATPIPGWDRATAGALRSSLSALSAPVYSAFSMNGALFTADMDLKAFPAIDETRTVAAARAVLRGALGFGRKPGLGPF